MAVNIALPQDEIAAFCQRHHIQRMLLFGSALREDFDPDSDVDVLVEFEPDAAPGWEIVSMADELGELLGHPVDLATPNGLSRFIRDDVLASAQMIYDRAAR